jgi:hypothetical protein
MQEFLLVCSLYCYLGELFLATALVYEQDALEKGPNLLIEVKHNKT